MASRPNEVRTLVQRLQELDSLLAPTNKPETQRSRGAQIAAEKEAAALRALSQSMVETFADNAKLSYVLEAATLSPVLSPDNYNQLFRAFVNKIASGTSNSEFLDPRFLVGFNRMLYCPQLSAVGTDLPFGSAMQSLKSRLKTVVDAAQEADQYRLIRTLSILLDCMREAGVRDISRKELIKPLDDLLHKSESSEEMRLAQASEYARKALALLPSDESLWKTLAKDIYAIVQGSAKVAGSVSTLDPSKLLEGLENWAQLPQLVQSIIDVVDRLSSLRAGFKTVFNDGKGVKKPPRWYFALRYTDMMLQNNCPKLLKSLLQDPELRCQSNGHFLCGLCAQLEQAVASRALSPDDTIVEELKSFLIEKGKDANEALVKEWVRLVTGANLPENPKSSPLGWGSRQFRTTIDIIEVPADEGRGGLVNKAWLSCSQAHIFYADHAIQLRYEDKALGLLKIERLNGDSLPMDKCYINLSIVKSSDAQKAESTDFPISISRRWGISGAPEAEQMSLSNIFMNTKKSSPAVMQRQGSLDRRRILIRGQAGVGKSTLCKKMVYDFIHEGMWNDVIDRIIWIPLRELKSNGNVQPQVQQLLGDKYFGGARDGHILAKAFFETSYADPNKTLFILDGLDEVYSEVDGRNELLLKLLNRPLAIITSRPSGIKRTHIKDIDLELETVGFYPAQVKEYVNAIAPDKAIEIQAFVDNHQTVQELARIPIQLDAMCHCLGSEEYVGHDISTMSELYIAITETLWRKDTIRLEKYHQHKPERISTGQARQLTVTNLENTIQSEKNILQRLAFNALCNSTIEFSFIYMKPFADLGTSAFGVYNLFKTSFLRTANKGPLTKPETSSYHFIHLSFQEFFAAQHFVEHWISEQDFPGLGYGADEFLRKNKYNARYDVFWRFVPGLLQAFSNDKQLIRCFTALENEPRDLLGPAHQRLIMHCLSEVASSEGKQGLGRLRMELESRLGDWLVFEAKLRLGSSLAADMDFPDGIVKACIQRNLDNALGGNLMRSFGYRLRISSESIKWAASMLKGGVSRDMRRIILCMMQKPSLTEDIFREVEECLKDGDRFVRASTLRLLLQLSDVSVDLLLGTVTMLGDKDYLVRSAAAEVLANQFQLPPTGDKKSTTAYQRQKQNLLDTLRQALTLLLDEQTTESRIDTIKVLSRTSGLPTEFLKAVEKQMNDDTLSVRIAAAAALLKSEAFMKKSVQAFVGWLQSPESDIVVAAASAFCLPLSLPDHFHLPDGILKSLVLRLGDPKSEVRKAASRALRPQSDLPDDILKALVVRLGDPESGIRMTAALALSHQPALSDNILQALTVCLRAPKDPMDPRDLGHYSKIAAADALTTRLYLPDEILKALANMLSDPEIELGMAAVRALEWKSDLPDDIMKALVFQLRCPESGVRMAAAGALRRQPALSNNILQALVGLLQAPESEARFEAVEALTAQTALPEDILETLIGHFEDLGKRQQSKVINKLARSPMYATNNKRFAFLIATPRVFNMFYHTCLDYALPEHLAWFVEGDHCCMNMFGHHTKVPFEQLKNLIQKTQADIGVPCLINGNKSVTDITDVSDVYVEKPPPIQLKISIYDSYTTKGPVSKTTLLLSVLLLPVLFIFLQPFFFTWLERLDKQHGAHGSSQ